MDEHCSVQRLCKFPLNSAFGRFTKIAKIYYYFIHISPPVCSCYYIYIYIYMCVCVCVCLCVCVCVCVFAWNNSDPTVVSRGERIVDIILGVEAGFETWFKIWLG